MGVFDRLRWFFRGRRRVEPDDPLAAFDRRIDALAARAAELRRSAATLLSTKGEMTRAQSAARRRAAQVAARAGAAGRAGDDRSAVVLEGDARAAEAEAAGFDRELARVDDDARALAEGTRRIEEELSTLRQERAGAEARLVASTALSGAGRAMAERGHELTALDAARDEVEKAKALAEVYREDLARKSDAVAAGPAAPPPRGRRGGGE